MQSINFCTTGGPSGKEPAVNAGDLREAGSIPRSGRSPGGGHGSPLQCSCLENPLDRGAWWATVHRVAELDTTEMTEHAHDLNSKCTRVCFKCLVLKII